MTKDAYCTESIPKKYCLLVLIPLLLLLFIFPFPVNYWVSGTSDRIDVEVSSLFMQLFCSEKSFWIYDTWELRAYSTIFRIVTVSSILLALAFLTHKGYFND